MSEDPDFKAMFWKALGHEFTIISRRSQDLSNCEITASQKAFKILMDNEDHIAAVEIYIDEILGISAATDDTKAQVLATALQTRDYIMSKVYGETFMSSASPLTQHRAVTSATLTSTNPRHPYDGTSGFVSSDVGAIRPCNSNLWTGDTLRKDILMSGPDDAKMNRLFDMYFKAQSDFDATSPKSLERTTAAKFLRDTTENCLTHIAFQQYPDSDVDAQAMIKGVHTEGILGMLKATLKETTKIAEKGSGGTKRRFEEDQGSAPQKSSHAKVLQGKAAGKRRVSPARGYGDCAPSFHSHRRVVPRIVRNSEDGNPRIAHSDCYRPAYIRHT
ncbi:hypothetical protein P7C71_g5637, partial [Lecanoromycetidae sp. Uapishka_2]